MYEIEFKFGEYRVCKTGSDRWIKAFATKEEAERWIDKQNARPMRLRRDGRA